MQEGILEANPTARIAVYALWLPVLGGDERSAWDPEVMTDGRVVHYWDADRAISEWFGQRVVGGASLVWDAYFLYGPDARWTDVPGPLVSSGATVIDNSDRIRSDIGGLLTT